MKEPRIADVAFLLREQYKDDRNLRARIELHRRFSTNLCGFHKWLFDLMLADCAAPRRILELGCGSGLLWEGNRERIPGYWRITLSDLSPGMLASTRGVFTQSQISFALLDATAIPFCNASFDAIIANHMLYHVPDRPRALSEISRVLRPGGVLYAATNGTAHVREIDDLIERYFHHAFERDLTSVAFGLETGLEQVRCCFDSVEIERYEDGFAITEVEPLMRYILSMRAAHDVGEAQITALQQEIEAAIQRDGVFRVTKDAGLFIARKS